MVPSCMQKLKQRREKLLKVAKQKKIPKKPMLAVPAKSYDAQSESEHSASDEHSASEEQDDGDDEEKPSKSEVLLFLTGFSS